MLSQGLLRYLQFDLVSWPFCWARLAIIRYLISPFLLNQEKNSVTHMIRTRILSNGCVHLAPQLLLAINWCPRRKFLLSVIAHRIGLLCKFWLFLGLNYYLVNFSCRNLLYVDFFQTNQYSKITIGAFLCQSLMWFLLLR